MMNDHVKIPETADEAAAMLRVSALWLHQKAPDVLRAVMATTEYAKDAARYRWLRDCAAQEIQFDYTTVDAHIGLLIPCRWSSDPSLCDAIDAARLATPAVGAA